MFGVDDAIIGAGITAASTAIGASNANSANSAASASSNYLQAQEFINSANIQQDEFRSTQDFNRTEAQKSRDWESQAINNQYIYNANQAQLDRNFNSNEAAVARGFNADQATITRDFNASEAQKSRDWSENMSNTAYQRAVAGMKAAGLNPILAAPTGGASTPGASTASAGAASGPAASGPAASGGSPGGAQASAGGAGGPGVPSAKQAVMQDVIGPAVASALQGTRLASDLKTQQTNRENTDASTSNIQSQTKYNYQNVSNAAELGRRLKNEADASEYAVPLAQKQVENTAWQAGKARQETLGLGQRNANYSLVGPGDVTNLGTWASMANVLGSAAGMPVYGGEYQSPGSSSIAGSSAPNPSIGGVPDFNIPITPAIHKQISGSKSSDRAQ